MTVTNQDILDAILRPMHEALQSQGITALYLAKKLKKELNAKLENGKPLWTIRQKARMDAHKLLAHYPAEKHEHTGKDGGPLEISYVNDWRNGNGHD